MNETIILKFQKQSVNHRQIFRCMISLLSCSVLLMIGCVHVPPQHQRLLSKPNMQFSDSAVFSYQDRLLTQFESGSAAFTGGQSGDCGSCAGVAGQ